MKKVQSRIWNWQAGIKICLTLCFVALWNVGWGDGHLQIMEKEKQIVLKGKISETLGEYDAILQGAVEYLICGRNGKAYESIIVVDATAKEIHDALSKLGIQVGMPPGYDEVKDELTPPTGATVVIFVEWKDGDKGKKVRAEELIRNVKTQKPMQQVAWIYSGSRMVPDLDSDAEDAMIPQAFMSNDIIALMRFDASALFQNPLPESEEENIYKKNDALMPKLGTPITLTIEVYTEQAESIPPVPTVAGVSLEIVGDTARSTMDTVAGVSYTLKVTNTGNMMDTITLEASAEVGIEGSVLGALSDRSIELEAGAEAEVTLKVAGEVLTAPGDYAMRVVATSGTDNTMTAEVTTTTTIETPAPPAAPTPWDVNGDGTVNIQDLVLVVSEFGQSGEALKGDVNSDGAVNVLDLVLVSSHFGEDTNVGQ